MSKIQHIAVFLLIALLTTIIPTQVKCQDDSNVVSGVLANNESPTNSLTPAASPNRLTQGSTKSLLPDLSDFLNKLLSQLTSLLTLPNVPNLPSPPNLLPFV